MNWTSTRMMSLAIAMLFCQIAIAQNPVSINVQITSSADDAEEYLSGYTTLTSSDIEMVEDGGNNLTAGFRFQNINLPAFSTINEAYLEFYVDEVTTASTDLNIFGHASGNSGSFTGATNSLTNRNVTASSSNWLPGQWLNLNASGPNQRTPNIAAIVQEIVNTQGWSEGNAMSFLIQGSGLRTAIAFDKNPSLAARLIIEADGVNPPGPVSGVVINEIAPFGSDLLDVEEKSEDWVELYNTTNEVIQLGGLYLTDDLGELDLWQIPAGISIAPGGYVTFFTDGDPNDGLLHADFSLKAKGEEVGLSQMTANGLVLLDSYEFPKTAFESSHGRIPNGTGNFVNLGTPTPNAFNNGDLYLEEPEIQLPSSIYPSAQTVTITHADPTATIRYTIDGSDPDGSSTFYTGPFTINENIALRAIALKSGYANSKPDNEAYLINENPNMDVIFITSDPDNFFSDETGIYVDGTNGVEAYCAPYPVNWAQDWERPANIKMFQPDGTLLWDVNAGVDIDGACSRNNPMKSLGISLREKEYGDKRIEYELYPNRDHDDYQRLKLRGSGQDFYRLGFRDMLTQSLLVGEVDVELQSGIPTIVFLNGEFWGLHNLREKYSGEYFEAIYDVDEKDLDILKSPGLDWVDVKKGNTEAYDDLFAFMETADLNNPASFQEFEDNVDVNEFVNYWIAMTYLANYDWPANNLTVWRERTAGAKWRYGMADTDGSTANNLTPDANADFNTLALISESNSNSWPNHSNSTLFLRKLLERDDYRAEWIQRTCSFIELYYNSTRVHAMTDEIVGLYEPNVPRHLDKWGNGNALGGSIFSWNQWIDLYKNFFVERPDYYRDFMESQYGLNGTYELNLNFNASTGGVVLVNRNTMDVPFNYTGTYMRGVPVRLTAEADDGFTFLYWLETGNTNPEIDYVANSNVTLTPVFSSAGCTPGAECNDNDPCTSNDVFDDNCNCAGTYTDNDSDGFCVGEDCDDNNGSVPAFPGTACDDGNPNTTNDVIQDDECTCLGIPACTDFDGDGVCAADDCDDNNGSIPTSPGTSCDDGNPLTNNDVILGDQCPCQGTPIQSGDYCDAAGDFPWHDWIANVKFNEIDYASGKSKYSNFLAVHSVITPGATYSIELTTGYSWETYDEYWKIWIDFNGDKVFDENTELIFAGIADAPANGSPTGVLTANVTLPDFTETNQLTRMRISMGRNNASNACGFSVFGEVEDYSVTLGDGSNRLAAPKNQKELLVFPVPTADEVNIAFPNTVAINAMRIVSIAGVQVYESPATDIVNDRMTLDVSDWVEGLYFIQVEVEVGKWRYGKMIISGNK